MRLRGLILAAALALGLTVSVAGAQESPPPTICNAEGTACITDDKEPYTIDRCDQHAGTGVCPAVPQPGEPDFTG